MIAGGVSNLHDPAKWNLDHIKDTEIRREYERVIDRIDDGLQFFQAIHADQSESLKAVEFYISHEGLLLNYEEALTEESRTNLHYNVGSHYLWIGDRTRQINGAHIEYFRGIQNPIGVKVGPSMKDDELVELVKVLNPNCEPGRLTLITRYGSKHAKTLLTQHIQALKGVNIPVLWVCDPCHGNTETTAEGRKTRNFLNMMEELMISFDVHREMGSHLGGVHLELTGDDVTECVGGSSALNEHGLGLNYETFCDPRLNYTQSIDMAFVIAQKLSVGKKIALKTSHSFSE